jgi:hypothetical protein
MFPGLGAFRLGVASAKICENAALSLRWANQCHPPALTMLTRRSLGGASANELGRATAAY